MGIDVHTLNFLVRAGARAGLGDTLTIGRQQLYVIEPNVKKLLKTRPGYTNSLFCESLLAEYLGASKIESLDNSDYEGATHIHDMNEEVPSSLCSKFDTVLDSGCLEHIYNAPQALKNCSMLLKPGGQILHILPANNYCGHGFWQFSPELFFSLYSEENGYKSVEIFIADLTDWKHWYFVAKPEHGKRVEVSSSNPLYILVRTELQGEGFSHKKVFQSDYSYAWSATKGSTPGARSKTQLLDRLKDIVKRNDGLFRFLYERHHRRITLNWSLSNRLYNNTNLLKLNVGDCILGSRINR